MIPESDDPRRDAILRAAFDRFVNYGFRRTSMEDIAGAAGMSRPALYQHYRNKADIFRAYVEAMVVVLVGDVRRILAEDGPIADRLVRALDQGFLAPHRMLAATPHGMELVGVNKEIAGDLFERWMGDMESVIAGGLRHAAERGRIAPDRDDPDCAKLARLIVNGVEGAKTRAATLQQAEADIRNMVRLITAVEHA